MKKIIQIVFLLLIVILSACESDSLEAFQNSSPECDTLDMTYANDVFPILRNYCHNCHNAGSARGNIILDSYPTAKKLADNGKLLGTIDHRPGYVPMPYNGAKLSACEISKISAWINQGTIE